MNIVCTQVDTHNPHKIFMKVEVFSFQQYFRVGIMLKKNSNIQVAV